MSTCPVTTSLRESAVTSKGAGTTMTTGARPLPAAIVITSPGMWAALASQSQCPPPGVVPWSLWVVMVMGPCATSSQTPLEQEVVDLSAAKSNACHYGVTQSGMFDESPEAEAASDHIRTERPLPTARLQALRRFTIAVTEQRGWVSDRDIDDFMEAGFNRSQVLEVICGVSLANLSSYVNHVAATPVDGGFYPTALDG